MEIKYVDLRESFLCGYLRIQGSSSASLMRRFGSGSDADFPTIR